MTRQLIPRYELYRPFLWLVFLLLHVFTKRCGHFSELGLEKKSGGGESWSKMAKIWYGPSAAPQPLQRPDFIEILDFSVYAPICAGIQSVPISLVSGFLATYYMSLQSVAAIFFRVRSRKKIWRASKLDENEENLVSGASWRFNVGFLLIFLNFKARQIFFAT